MTTDDNGSGVWQKEARKEPGPAITLLGLLVLTLLFLTAPVLLSLVLAAQRDQSFVDVARGAAFAINPSAEQGLQVETGFAFLAVMATIVIGIVFSLPPGGLSALPRRSRKHIEFLLSGVMLVVTAFVAAVIWVMIFGRWTFELVPLLVCACLVFMVAGVAELKPPVHERLSDARRNLENLRAGARAAGFVDGLVITRRQEISAELVYWSLPTIGTFVLGGAGLIWDFHGYPVENRAREPLFLLAGGAVLVALAWRLTATYPPHGRMDQILSWAGRVAGLFVMGLSLLSAMLQFMRGFFVLSTLAIVAVGALYFSARLQRRVPFMRTIRESATRTRLQQAEEWYESVLRELEDQRQIETPKPAAKASAREPWIRVEVFRRPPRRGSSEPYASTRR